ncbi:AMP-binding protein [Geojedonia litorea]|uniref:AMP-binding protein n=1 Tax=Geojedonia litorea TaxID=1268269 RepID=A0ABV9N3J7_9FLAO
MIPTFDKIHLKFKLNNTNYSHEELKEVAYSLVKEGVYYEKTIGDFLLDWLDDKDYIVVNTSGSTGQPKVMHLHKQVMVNSAIATGNYLQLEPGQTALHCLPTNFIAGKMMLVRAMILGLEIDMVEPTSQPIFDYDKTYHFAAMLPMQLKSTLNYLHNVKIMIVGGSLVSPQLIEMTKGIQTKVFATYGMTETATHIALKPINHAKKSAFFKALPGVSLSQDDRDCLVIEAPSISDEKVITNDIVKLHSETEFEWLGRYDNVINSGGIKIFPEQIEEKLRGKIDQQFFVTSEPNDQLGEQLILILESDENTLRNDVFVGLKKFETPKAIYTVRKFEMTPTGKIKRTETLKLVNRK